MARILTVTLNPALDVTMHLPSLQPGAVNRAHAVETRAAGKGLNVAQVLADLGHQLTVSGFLGSDNAQPFERLFAERQFVDEFIRVPGETRSNIKLAERGGQVTDINSPGLQADAMAQAELLDRLKRLAPEHDLVVVAGSLARGIEPAWLGGLVGQFRAQGVRVALDTSGAALRMGVDALPWLIKPNEHELADVCSLPLASPGALAEQAHRLRQRGIEHVVISQGSDGVSWFGPRCAWHASPPTVPVISTVGAGDSLLAGMLHGLLAQWPPERTLSYATAIAAQAVGQVSFGITDAGRLEELDAQVTLRNLAP